MPILFFYSRGGQIRPAKTFCPARGVAFSTHAITVVYVILEISALIFENYGPKGERNL